MLSAVIGRNADRRFIPTCVGLMADLRGHKPLIVRFIPTCVGLMNKADGATYATYGSSPHAWGASFFQ